MKQLKQILPVAMVAILMNALPVNAQILNIYSGQGMMAVPHSSASL